MSTYRILCVDDQEDVVEIVNACLSADRDLEVRSCNSGAKALSILETWRPDLILMDVMMPEMDGPATLLRMRETIELTCVPVVFLTAHSDSKSVSDLMNLGAAAIINKPFQIRLLAKQVREVLQLCHSTVGVTAQSSSPLIDMPRT